MKPFSFLTRALGSALLVAIPPVLHAQPGFGSRAPVWEQSERPAMRGRVQPISRNAEAFGMVRMSGRPVRSANGEELSTVTDFLVEPQTGRVRFAILPSGGGPKGMTYRIIPISAFTGATEDALTLRLNRAQWDRVGTLEEWQLKDVVTIDVDHQQRLSKQLGIPVADVYDGHGPAELVRASTLRGQTIRSDNGQVGRIDDVVIDVGRRESAVVFTSDRAFAGSEQRYVVPFQHLGARESGSWRSRLNREDFATPEPPPQPTGRDDRRDARDYNDTYTRDYPNQAQPGELQAIAASVQQSLDRSWARGRVDVGTEGRRIVLRGLVDNEQERVEIERAASEAARGVRIDNQLAVRRR